MSHAIKKTDVQKFEERDQSKWNRRILIVDDEKEILNAYATLLEAKKTGGLIQSSRASSNVIPISAPTTAFELVTVGSFDAAIKEVERAVEEQKPFAMGFFDVRLGEARDGVELAKEVRRIDPRMGVVFVTAYNDRSLDSIGNVLGADVTDQWDFLNKPFNGNEIVQKARNLTTLWNLRREREDHAQALAELNRLMLQSERITSVAAVARGVTHEFGNLLMQIIGKAEISRNKTENEMREAFDRIIDAGQRASEILDRFNNLSDNKSPETNKTKCSPDAIINEAIDLVGHLLRREKVKVELELQPLSGVLIDLHGTSILQIFINLIINAIHALETVEDKKIFISAEVKSDSIVLRVRDNGPGAPPEFLDKLTQAFFTTKGSKGTGLGLAICREIVEIDHSGEFKVANAKAGGFEVTISLPKEG